MNKLFGIVVLVIILLPQSVVAGCWVDDETFFSKSRMNMTAFTIYMGRKESGDLDRALAMIDNGRVAVCSRASCTVIERRKDGMVHVNILGIGKVWIYEGFLNCR
jgi:hypothetical protein